jgi:hypothetical protein
MDGFAGAIEGIHIQMRLATGEGERLVRCGGTAGESLSLQHFTSGLSLLRRVKTGVCILRVHYSPKAKSLPLLLSS